MHAVCMVMIIVESVVYTVLINAGSAVYTVISVGNAVYTIMISVESMQFILS